MVKRIIITCLLCIIACINPINAKAAGEEDMLNIDIERGIENSDISIQNFFSQSAEDSIYKIQQNFISSYGKEEGDEGKYEGLSFCPELSYKDYILTEELVVTQYMANGSLESNMSDGYILKTPIKNHAGNIVGIASFFYQNGTYELGAYEKIKEEQLLLLNSEDFEQLITNSGIDIVNNSASVQVKLFTMNLYRITSIYIKDGANEYVIPLSSMAESYGLDCNKGYSCSDFFELLGEQSKEIMAISESDEYVYGGVSSADKKVNAISILAAGLVLFIFVIVFVVIKKRKLSLERKE